MTRNNARQTSRPAARTYARACRFPNSRRAPTAQHHPKWVASLVCGIKLMPKIAAGSTSFTVSGTVTALSETEPLATQINLAKAPSGARKCRHPRCCRPPSTHRGHVGPPCHIAGDNSPRQLVPPTFQTRAQDSRGGDPMQPSFARRLGHIHVSRALTVCTSVPSGQDPRRQ